MDGNFGEENQDFNKWGWGRISSCRDPCFVLVTRVVPVYPGEEGYVGVQGGGLLPAQVLPPQHRVDILIDQITSTLRKG